MKRMTYFVMALALVLGFTQCKKEQTNDLNAESNLVPITLRFVNNSESRVEVDPTGNNGQYQFAPVKFENGDKIYVGYHGQYVGELTCSNANVDSIGTFSGDVEISQQLINQSFSDNKLHFYLLGGNSFSPVRNGNTFTVNISDQTSRYPVISYATSKETYPSNNNNYTAILKNKCSIMKFNVVTESTAPICIMGMNNMVTVDFTNPGGTDNGFTYDMDGVGEIKMHSTTVGSGTPESPYEMWAIVLPQPALSAGAHEAYTSIAEVMASNEDYLTGTRCAIPEIGRNQYLSDTTNRTLTVNETPEFSVSADANTPKVLFAPANLQATRTSNNWSSWTWSFMEHQYSTVEENEVELGFNYSEANIVSSFVWSATGTTIGGFFNPNSTSYTQQLPISQRHNLRIEYGEEWGKCANDANNGNGLYGYNNWRTPSIEEWTYVAQTRTVTTGNKRPYGYAIVEGVKGIILLPDNWNGAIDPSFVYGSVDGMTNRCSSSTTPSWAAMEAAGVVFLPAAGWRSATTEIEDVGNYGTYWSIDYGDENYLGNKLRTFAWCFSFNYYGGDDEELPEDEDIVFENDWVCYSSCVRLIRNVNNQ